MLNQNGGVKKNHVFDHETRKSALFPCYRLKTNDFLSSNNQKSQNWHIHTPAVKSLLLRKKARHITTHFVVQGHTYILIT